MSDDGKPPSPFDQPTEVMTPEELQNQYDSMLDANRDAAPLRDDPTDVERDLASAPTDPEGLEPPPARAAPETPEQRPRRADVESEATVPEAAVPRPEDGNLFFSAWPTHDGGPHRPKPVPAPIPPPTAQPKPEPIPPPMAEPKPAPKPEAKPAPLEPDEPTAPDEPDDDWASKSDDGWPAPPTGVTNPALWSTGEVDSEPGMVTIPPDVMKVAASGGFPRPVTEPDAETIRSRRLMAVGFAAMTAAVTSGIVVVTLALTGAFSDAEPPENDEPPPALPALATGAAEAGSELADSGDTGSEIGPEDTAEDEPSEEEAAADEPEPEQPEVEEAEVEEPGEPSGPLWLRFPGVFPPHAARTGFVSPDKLDELLASLEECKGPIRVFGYAATGGDTTDDEVLALARAEYVREVLIDAGVPESRLRAQSARPRNAEAGTEEDLPRKRRVVLMCKAE